MKLRDDTERAIYAAAFVQRLAEERNANGRASAIAASGARTPDEREIAEAQFDRGCAAFAVGHAESAVTLHREARKARP